MVEGRCHCGAVALTVPQLPKQVTQCGCSICAKLGTIWAYYPDAQVRITGVTSPYICNRRVIAFHHCPICGCTTHWQTLGTDFGRMGLNARMLNIDIGSVPVEVASGPVGDDPASRLPGIRVPPPRGKRRSDAAG